jgi:hypothetical protein
VKLKADFAAFACCIARLSAVDGSMTGISAAAQALAGRPDGQPCRERSPDGDVPGNVILDRLRTGRIVLDEPSDLFRTPIADTTFAGGKLGRWRNGKMGWRRSRRREGKLSFA